MERVVVGVSPFSRRSRSLAVSHVGSGLPHGVEPGDYIVVHDPTDGANFTASVADIDFRLEDTVYRLELGTRITPTEAAEWLAPATDDTDAPMSTRRLMDLLGELRRRERALQELLSEIAQS